MSARWYCRVRDEELGPLTFGMMVDLARAGTLAEDDSVRRAPLGDWQRAGTVVGLFRAARTSRDAVQRKVALQNAATPTSATLRQRCGRAAGRLRRPQFRLSGMAWVVGAGVALMCSIWYGVASWYRTAHRFPKPRSLHEQTSEERLLLRAGFWSTWEYALLWFDVLLLTGVALLVLYRGLRTFWPSGRRR